MEFIDVINERYSVRGYLDKKVEKEKLDYVLKAATIAPTGVNAQPFKVYVIDTKKYKDELSEIYAAKWFVEAPLVLAVV
ncbi:MAG: nitroreductase family protein, partial [Methanobrevibacter sp.]|nr:nitroreductase family protein [Methanobrevibacter sp.]